MPIELTQESRRETSNADTDMEVERACWTEEAIISYKDKLKKVEKATSSKELKENAKNAIKKDIKKFRAKMKEKW